MRNLYFDLNDPDDMEKQMAKYTEDFKKALKKAKQNLRKNLREKIRYELSRMENGMKHYSSIILEYTDYGLVVIFPEYWFYVEFGTGLRGRENPHPNPSYDNEFTGYNVGKYSSDPSKFGGLGYFPFPTKDGEWRITAGQPAHPLSYKLYEYSEGALARLYEKWLKEYDVW